MRERAARVAVVDYTDAELAREAASPYVGEGPFALWHVNEELGTTRFEARPGYEPHGAPLRLGD